MTAQKELFAAPRHADNADVLWLENLLANSACWMTAKDITLTVNGKLIDRDIRELASSSFNVISGQKGYKHIQHSTAEEINHAANWLESQAKKMADRAGGIRRNAHRIFG